MKGKKTINPVGGPLVLSLKICKKKGVFADPFMAFHKDYQTRKYIEYQVPQINVVSEYLIDSIIEIKKIKNFSQNDIPVLLIGISDNTTLLLSEKDVLLCKKDPLFPTKNMILSLEKYPTKIHEIKWKGEKLNNIKIIFYLLSQNLMI